MDSSAIMLECWKISDGLPDGVPLLPPSALAIDDMLRQVTVRKRKAPGVPKKTVVTVRSKEMTPQAQQAEFAREYAKGFV